MSPTPISAVAPASATTFGVTSFNQFKTNVQNGKRAEIYAIVDLLRNGWSVCYTGGRGQDFAAIKLNPPSLMFIEVKLNQSRLSKFQKKFQTKCKNQKIDYFVFRVTTDQLEEEF